jgi:hypothetical protein
MKNALLRDNGADQKGDQDDDRYRLPADAVELVGQRRQPQRSRPAHHAEDGDAQRPQHLQERRYIFARPDGAAADIAQFRHDGIARRGRGRRAPVDLAHLLDQAAIILRDADDIGAVTGGNRPPRHLFQQPGAERVEFAYSGHIDLDDAGPIELRRNFVGEPLERGGIRRRPGPARAQFERVAQRRCR